jgi:hypothetical protein
MAKRFIQQVGLVLVGPDLAGNAIDFCMRFLGLSFHEAMRRITGR